MLLKIITYFDLFLRVLCNKLINRYIPQLMNVYSHVGISIYISIIIYEIYFKIKVISYDLQKSIQNFVFFQDFPQPSQKLLKIYI